MDQVRRFSLLLPQVVLFGGMAVMLVVHPNAFTSAVHSTRALVVNAVLFAGWVVLSWFLWRWPRVYVGVLSVVAIAAIAVLVVPTLRDERVVEEFPAAVAEPTPATSSTPSTSAGPDAATTTAPAAPTRLSTGTLRGIGHDATGTASV